MSPDVRARAERMGLPPTTLRTLESRGMKWLHWCLHECGSRRPLILVEDVQGRL